MYKLYYFPRNASWVPHLLLKEMGADYELVLVDRKINEQKSEAYMALNPTGRIPTLMDGEQVVFESAAISLYLCEKNVQAKLMPAIEDPARASFYQWLFYLTTTLQPELMVYIYPEKHTTDHASSASIVKAQEARVTEMFALLDDELAGGKAYLIGDAFSVCDCFLFMYSHWAGGFKKPPLSFKHLGRYLRNIAKRPAVISVCGVEGTGLAAYE